ncbi:uncharacterized protein LOC101454561 isoform X2 [Ceratitis capitata]|uniref:uncharacterized protein LOC101454561 isoform X2 n=1 Tax=Ceratitis capitata TaxID=7213 RepID=UPI0006188E9D|nr:uncharacterized protein LOC101454561 isoform X2 [Ceratitis capitata]
MVPAKSSSAQRQQATTQSAAFMMCVSHLRGGELVQCMVVVYLLLLLFSIRFSEQFINLARQRINNLNPLKKKELVVCSSGPLKRLFAPIEIVGAAPYGLYVCIYARICVDGRHGTAERLLMTAIMTATTQWMAHSLIANFMWHRRRTWRAA